MELGKTVGLRPGPEWVGQQRRQQLTSRSHTRHALTPRVSVSRSSTPPRADPVARGLALHLEQPHSSNDSTRLIAERRSDVRAIQHKLDGKGYGLAVDGPKTEGAVKHFQAKAGSASTACTPHQGGSVRLSYPL
jgi:hypothetical protein